jgi:hypothetical protein
MLRRFLFGLGLVLLALTTGVQAAGTVVVTTSGELGNRTQVYRRYSVAWTSTAGGAVSGNPFSIVAGRLLSVRFVPGGTTPTDLYDVTLVDSDGTISSGDLLSGTGADRSNATSSILSFDPPIYEDGTRTLDVVVANAGASKTGTVVILVQVQ